LKIEVVGSYKSSQKCPPTTIALPWLLRLGNIEIAKLQGQLYTFK